MSKEQIYNMLDQLFRKARRQFGNAVQSQWFHDEEGCPGCGRQIDAMKVKGEDALSFNAFIFRERGVLIGYFLCGRCAKHIFRESKKNPFKQTPLHGEIERNLRDAYIRHLGSLNA
jgi:hypothetical protein